MSRPPRRRTSRRPWRNTAARWKNTHRRSSATPPRRIAYWNSIAEKRRSRIAKRARGEPILIEDYVLEQPPVYTGPPRPRDPSKPQEEAPPPNRLCAGGRRFSCRGPAGIQIHAAHCRSSETEFKRAYAKTALAAGLTKDQVVRVYGFEATGNGNYDIQAGLEFNKRARAITTALGYNQLLATNTVEIIAEDGHQFIEDLKAQGGAIAGERKTRRLKSKIEIVRKMVEFCRSVPDDWSQHEALAGTQRVSASMR